MNSRLLAGVGMTSGPNATLSAASLTFGGIQLVGTTSPALYVKLINYGTTALNLASMLPAPILARATTAVRVCPPEGSARSK